MDPQKAISGWFLAFSPNEIEFIQDTLPEFGYSADIDGLKRFILDKLEEPEEPDEQYEAPRQNRESAADRVIRNVSDYIREHPEQVAAYGDLAKAGISKLVRNAMNRMGGMRQRDAAK